MSTAPHSNDDVWRNKAFDQGGPAGETSLCRRCGQHDIPLDDLVECQFCVRTICDRCSDDELDCGHHKGDRRITPLNFDRPKHGARV